MSTWFRFDEAFTQDPRLLELGFLLGDEDKALACITRLWAWERSGSKRGVIQGEHAAQLVERVAGWKGEPGAFVAACERVRLLVRGAFGLRSPGFAQRSGVVHEKAKGDAERMRAYRAAKKAAKQAAEANPAANATPDAFANRSRDVQGNDTRRNEDVTGSVQDKEPPRSPSVHPATPSPTATSSPATPSLTLVPSPAEAPRKKPKGPGPEPMAAENPAEPKTPKPSLSGLEAAVFEAWVQTWALGPAYRMTPDRRKVIASRVKEGFSEADLVDAVKGSKLDPWPERPQHNDLAQLLKPTNVPKFAEWHRKGSSPVRPAFDPRKGFVPVASQKHAYSQPAPGEPTRLEDMPLMFPEEAQPRPPAPPTPPSSLAGGSP